MIKKDPKIFIEHILESISLVGQYIFELSKKDFLQSKEVQDATIRRIEIIGEATRQIANDLREKYPEIKWREIMAMRNLLIHEYFAVDMEATWDTIKQDLPKLERQLKKVIKELE
ncbi:MAG TPA: DUF86 domain-containing protein [Patescibacteria group bacterium]|nr:DUF86 domain-containing protein [Patescibacteria group bacterium]